MVRSNKRVVPLWGAVIALVVFCYSSSVLGQAVTGTLLGTVTDTSGAAVTGAKVSATVAATGAVHDSVTNESGNYSFPDLQPGTYAVSAEATGFKRVTQQNIGLLSNSSVRVDLTLTPGNVSETVTVTTAPPLLQTDRADISTKIDAANVVQLPLTTGRNFQSLLNLVPGTSPATFQHSQFFNAQNSLQTQANGMPRVSNLYQIEGIDDDERTGLLQILIPPAEAIQTVDVSTNNYEPELGRSVGAITNVTLKSGTNAFHGSAFEYIQNNAVNARSYFSGRLATCHTTILAAPSAAPLRKTSCSSSATTSARPTVKRLAARLPSLMLAGIPTPEPLRAAPDPAGCVDLSGALAGTIGQIYDPNTGDGTAAHPRTPFTNNQIPFSMINPVSLNMLQQLNAAYPKYGKLNSTLPLSNPTNNYTTNLPFTKTANSFDVKLDWIAKEKDHLNGRYQLAASQHLPGVGLWQFPRRSAGRRLRGHW